MSNISIVKSRSDLYGSINKTVLAALFLLNLAAKLNSTPEDQFQNHLFKRSQGGKYSKTNFDNLQAYFDSIQSDNKHLNRTIETNVSPVNFDGQNKSSNNSSKESSSNDDNDIGDLGRATGRPPGRRSTTRRPRTTRSPRTTTRRTTTIKPSTTTPSGPALKPVDATWILICGILIFTMQTGFGMLEGGIVSQKNETNIMLKNVADVVLGGFSYWAFGYGITYGTLPGSVSFFGLGYYFVDESYPLMGDLFTSFFFQLSFATTSTTIVSGAVAERMNFKAYCLFSLIATFTYSVQARWVWFPDGFLAQLGAVDIAGSGAVHLVGGSSAFVAAWMVGPRLGRYDTETGPPPMGNPTNALIGLLLLWWGWIAFNAGSTFGMTENKWQYAARAASTTVIASIGGGLVGIFWAFVKPGSKVFDAIDVINGVLGALVGVTGGCALYHSVEAFFTGVIGACVVTLASYLPDLLKIDDPVGAIAVHGFGGIWGLLAVGVFAEDDYGVLGVTKGRFGLVRAGGWYLLGVQTLTAVCIIAWAVVSTFIILFLINFIIPLRVSPHEELVGLDFVEHGIRKSHIGTTPSISLFGSNPEIMDIQHGIVGYSGQNNPAHEKITHTLRDLRPVKPKKTKKKMKFKNMAMFALAFKKLQSKGNRISPRDRQYIFDQYSSPLKDSTESLQSENRRNASIQTEIEEETIRKSSSKAHLIPQGEKTSKPTLWQRITGKPSKSVQTDEDSIKSADNSKGADKKPSTAEKAVSANPEWKQARYYDENRLEHDQMTYLP